MVMSGTELSPDPCSFQQHEVLKPATHSIVASPRDTSSYMGATNSTTIQEPTPNMSAGAVKRKLVVCGGNGFLGSRICKAAVARDWDVTSIR